MHDKVLALLYVYLETVLLQISLVFFLSTISLPSLQKLNIVTSLQRVEPAIPLNSVVFFSLSLSLSLSCGLIILCDVAF